jgi:hypothetical protein
MDGGGRKELQYTEGENNKATNFGLAKFWEDVLGEM